MNNSLRFKLQPCRSHVREVRGAGAVNLNRGFVFLDSLSVLPLAKVVISLQQENFGEFRCFARRETEEGAMLRTTSLRFSASSNLAFTRSARLRALAFSNFSLSKFLLLVLVLPVLTG